MEYTYRFTLEPTPDEIRRVQWAVWLREEREIILREELKRRAELRRQTREMFDCALNFSKLKKNIHN